MIEATGYSSKERGVSGLVMACLEVLLSIRFNFGGFPKRVNLVRNVGVSVWILKHEFEVVEFVKNYEKYLGEERMELAEEALRLAEGLWGWQK